TPSWTDLFPANGSSERPAAAPPDRAVPPPAPIPVQATAAPGPVTAPPPDPTMQPPTESSGPPEQLPRGWVNDPEKLRRILLAIHEIDSAGNVVDNEHFVERFCSKMGWKTLNRYQTGGVFAWLARKGYVSRLLRGSRPIGYELTEEGWELVREAVEAGATSEAAPGVPPPDPAKIILTFGQLAQQFA